MNGNKIKKKLHLYKRKWHRLFLICLFRLQTFELMEMMYCALVSPFVHSCCCDFLFFPFFRVRNYFILCIPISSSFQLSDEQVGFMDVMCGSCDGLSCFVSHSQYTIPHAYELGLYHALRTIAVRSHVRSLLLAVYISESDECFMDFGTENGWGIALTRIIIWIT